MGPWATGAGQRSPDVVSVDMPSRVAPATDVVGRGATVRPGGGRSGGGAGWGGAGGARAGIQRAAPGGRRSPELVPRGGRYRDGAAAVGGRSSAVGGRN